MCPDGVQLPGDDPRNDDVLFYVDGKFLPRDEAAVSVFDGALLGGDAVWESLRLVRGRVGFLDAHLDRLIAGAGLLLFSGVPTRGVLAQAVLDTIGSNEMEDGVDLRVTLTRGRMRPASRAPWRPVAGATLMVTAEYRVAGGVPRALVTSPVRYDDGGDLRLKALGRLGHVQAALAAAQAGADAALLCDGRGFVAGCHDSNIFAVRDGVLWTPSHCLAGITRGAVVACWRDAGGTVHEADLSLEDVLSASEVFVTTSRDGVMPVGRIDAQVIGDGAIGVVTQEVTSLYVAAIFAD